MNKFSLILFFAFLFNVLLVNASSIDDINSRLEDVEDEITFQQDMQLYRQSLKNNQAQTNSNSEFINSNSFIKKQDKIYLVEKNGTVHAIRTDTLTPVADGIVSYLTIIEFTSPRYEQHGTYFRMINGVTLDCKKRQISMDTNTLYDINFKKIAYYDWGLHFHPIPKGTSAWVEASWVCGK